MALTIVQPCLSFKRNSAGRNPVMGGFSNGSGNHQ
jgi:hypothetical protein